MNSNLTFYININGLIQNTHKSLSASDMLQDLLLFPVT